MLNYIFDRGHRWIAGGFLVGEITAFLTADKLQLIGCMVGGIFTFVSHFWWANKGLKRKNAILDVLAAKVKRDIREGKPLPYPELVHLLVDDDHHAHDAAGDEAKG